jgi:hypothetical protein
MSWRELCIDGGVELSSATVERLREAARGLAHRGLCISEIVARMAAGSGEADKIACAAIYRQETTLLAQEGLFERFRGSKIATRFRPVVESGAHSLRPADLVSAARGTQLSTVFVVSQLLRTFLRGKGESQSSIKAIVSAAVKDPTSLEGTSLAHMREWVEACLEADMDSGPKVEAAKRDTGAVFERRLEEHLEGLGVPFETEAMLRGSGARLTPDALLLVPVGVAIPGSDAPSSLILNWIDSKAMFGSRAVAAAHSEQAQKYAAEHGRGMVVYWLGMEEGLQELFPDSVLVAPGFPKWLLSPGETTPSQASPLGVPPLPPPYLVD